jgi:hypothetical protein
MRKTMTSAAAAAIIGLEASIEEGPGTESFAASFAASPHDFGYTVTTLGCS